MDWKPPDWLVSSDDCMEALQLHNTPPRFTRWQDARPMLARALVLLNRIRVGYMGAKDEVYQSENTLHRIREAFMLREAVETSAVENFYGRRVVGRVIGWYPHPFSADNPYAFTTNAIVTAPPPRFCDICNQLEGADCHVVAASQEKPA